MSRDLERGGATRLHAIGTERLIAFAWSRDGRRLAMGRGIVASDVELIARQ